MLQKPFESKGKDPPSNIEVKDDNAVLDRGGRDESQIEDFFNFEEPLIPEGFPQGFFDLLETRFQEDCSYYANHYISDNHLMGLPHFCFNSNRYLSDAEESSDQPIAKQPLTNITGTCAATHGSQSPDTEHEDSSPILGSSQLKKTFL